MILDSKQSETAKPAPAAFAACSPCKVLCLVGTKGILQSGDVGVIFPAFKELAVELTQPLFVGTWNMGGNLYLQSIKLKVLSLVLQH